MRPVTRGLALPATLAALALGLAACGNGSESGSDSDLDDLAALSPAAALMASYDNLSGQSYTMETTMTINGLDFMESTNLVEGEATHSSQTLYMSALLEAAGEDPEADPELAAMMELMFSDVQTETIMIDGAVYLQMSGGMFAAMSAQFGEDAWFTVDLTESADLNEIYSQIGGVDLASQTDTLLNDLTDVEETSDGVYTGTLRGDSELMESLLDATGPAGTAPDVTVDAIEVTITVDGDGLLQSMEMVFPEIEGATMHLTSEVVEVGGSYDITAPDSENVYPFEDFVNAMQ